MKKKQFLALLLLLICAGFSQVGFSQLRFDYGFYDSILVRPIGDTAAMRMAWSGGLNAPQFSEIDANFDGKQDLFVFDRDGNINFVFLNQGETGEVKYVCSRPIAAQIPKMTQYALMKDMNCDGKPDIVTSNNSNMALFLNQSTDSSLEFVQKTDFQFYNKQNGVIVNQWRVDYITTILQQGQSNEIKTNMGMPTSDIPGLADFDGDGDIDILHFGANPTLIELEINNSIEDFGSCDSLSFVNETRCWGEISEGVTDNSIYLGVSCRPSATLNLTEDYQVKIPEKGGIQRHSGSSVTALDLNGDSLMDALIGDIGFNNLVALHNNGTKTQAKVDSVDNQFPVYDTPADITIFPAAYYVDIDNDNKRELLVAPNEDNASINTKNVWLYENNGLDESPIFDYQQDDFLVNQMIDFGTGTNPVFVDINGDSLLDIVCGNYGVFDGNGNYESSLYYFENIGQAQNPSFQLVNTDLFGLQSTGVIDLSPAFADLDRDGDMDLVLGNSDGEVLFYERTGNFSVTRTNKFGSGIDVGQHAKPTFYDLDKDGTEDLIVGDRNGTLALYRNAGSNSLLVYEPNVVFNNLGGIDVSDQLNIGFSNAFFAELDTTGNSSDTTSLAKDTYLFVGANNGFVYLYNNIDSNLTGAFTLVDSLFTGYSRPVIAGGDVTGNDKPDMLIGNLLGGLGIVMKDFGFIPAPPPIDTTSISIEELSIGAENSIKLYPNPTSALLHVEWKASQNESSFVSLFDVNGKAIQAPITWVRQGKLQLEVSGLEKGVYVIQILGEGARYSKRFIKK